MRSALEAKGTVVDTRKPAFPCDPSLQGLAQRMMHTADRVFAVRGLLVLRADLHTVRDKGHQEALRYEWPAPAFSHRLSLTCHCLSLTCHCLSLAFHCIQSPLCLDLPLPLVTAFPWPSTAFLDLPPPSVTGFVLSLAFVTGFCHCISLTFHCLHSLHFCHCLSSSCHRL